MAQLKVDGGEIRGFASPACLMHEVDPNYMGLAADAPAQRAAIMRWRKAERERLICARLALDPQARAARTERLFARLDALLPDLEGKVVSLYWPFRGEPDPRNWLAAIAGRGAATALPAVLRKGAPLAFRAWRPGEPLVFCAHGIATPRAERDVAPDIVLAPVVGFDPRRFRLGYGGGYFDRTLAALSTRPRVIGVGFAEALINTIRPLRHDIAMDLVVTDEAVI